jgi:hypothetical protein
MGDSWDRFSLFTGLAQSKENIYHADVHNTFRGGTMFVLQHIL